MSSLRKLGNNKYFLGNYAKGWDRYRGWFVGSFLKKDNPTKSDKFEIAYMKHRAGDEVEMHYHRKKVELLIMLDGEAMYKVNNKSMTLSTGKFLFVDINNVISGKFTKPSKLFAIHAPSIPTDKVIV